jgi:DNA-binding SARP family transcriptional activator/tetratricopeptide (TPR) repeat protein
VAGFAEFRLLGPLEVVADGRLLEINSARQQIVLCTLLLQGKGVVPLGRLVDAVWDDMPPTTAKSQVQTCISALRRKLAGAASECVIATRSVGYSILLPDDALDVARFERLTERGRASAADHRLDEAVLNLRTALALWRGPAADGVESKLVQAVATRLNENRIGVLEECIEHELALGRHRDLTGELSELVRQYPLRERLRAQHILALYRSSRQAEALESFREARQIFIDGLGIEPGEGLRALERAVLSNDPALDLNPKSQHTLDWAKHDASVISRQLPAAIADFTGHQDVQRSMIALLSAGSGPPRHASGLSGLVGYEGGVHGYEPAGPRYLPVVICTGKGGVGKTALALQVAQAVRHEYPDGQLFVQMRGASRKPAPAAVLLEQLLRALGVGPPSGKEELADRTAVYRSVLGDRRVLIVLDDADSQAQVAPLIPGSPNCAVIVTSRRPLVGLGGAHQFDIDVLQEPESVDLLAQVIGRERVHAEPSAAVELVRLCDRLPLALRIVGGKLATRPHWRIEKMVRRLADEGRRLDELALCAGAGVRDSIALSYQGLSRDARRLFRRLALVGTPQFASWVGAPLLDMAPESAEDVLDSLVEARLIEASVREDGRPRFHLGDLTRIYAGERLAEEDPATERAFAQERLLRCWLSLAAEAHRRSYGGDFALLHGSSPGWPLPDDTVDQLLGKPLSWFRAEHDGLVSAVLRAAEVGLDELCWDLALTSVTRFESEYQVADWRKTHEAALEITRRAGNLRGEAAILFSLGNLAIGDRLCDAARYLEPALRIFGQIGDTHGLALTQAIWAFVDRLGGRCDTALERYNEALDGFRSVGDRVGEIDVLTNMAQIMLDREQFTEVEAIFDKALVLCRSLDAPRIMAQTEHRLGEFYLRKGDLERAERTFGFVLQLVRDVLDVVGEAYALQGLGIVHTRQRQYALAEADLGSALGLSRHVGDNLVHGRALLAYVEFYLARDELRQASSLIDEALVVFGEIGPAAVWRARFLELKAQLDERSGRQAAASAARQTALELVSDSDPALARALSASIGGVRPARGNGQVDHLRVGTSGQLPARLARSAPRRPGVAPAGAGVHSVTD